MNHILLALCIIYYTSGFTQTSNNSIKKTQHFILAGTIGHGRVLPTNPFVKGENLQLKPIDQFRYASVKFLWQNPGYTFWQQVHRGPYYGFGFSFSDFYNKQEIGTPQSWYGILGLPLKKWQCLELFTEFQFGLASHWNYYDSINNPKNIVIGGGLTIHLDIAIKAQFNMSPRWNAGIGLSFIHFSNGGFERPNRGFNIYSPFVDFKYRFAQRPDYLSLPKPPIAKKTNDLYLMLGYGDHQLVEHELDTNYFAIAGISVIYFTQLSNAFRLGLGSDFNYWMGLTANPDGTMGPRTMDNLTTGIILQPEMIIDRLTLTGGIGIYTRHLHYGNFRQTYQRLGVRFNFYKNISLGVNIRAVHFMLAEFLEFNLGYQFKLGK